MGYGKLLNADFGPTVVGQSVYEESSTPKAKLGHRLVLGERVFRYGKAGSSNLSRGKMCQGPAPVANHKNIAVAAAAAAGATEITVTLGATAATKNQYAEGYLHVNDANGEGQCYKIKSHPAGSASGSLTVTLYDPIETALTTSSEVTLTANPFNGVIVAPNGGLTQIVVGVPLIAVTAGYYAWFQTRGPAPVLGQGTLVIGQNVGLGGTADGACGPVSADTTFVWGKVMQVNASTEYALIWLTLE